MPVDDGEGAIDVELNASGIVIVWRDNQISTDLPPLTPEQALVISRMLIEAAEEYHHEYRATGPRPAQLHPA